MGVSLSQLSEQRLVAGRYRLIRRISGRGIGVVWQAYDERPHHKIVLKHLLIPAQLTGPQTEKAKRRAMREGRIAAKLAHPHAIGAYDVLEELFSVTRSTVYRAIARARRAA